MYYRLYTVCCCLGLFLCCSGCACEPVFSKTEPRSVCRFRSLALAKLREGLHRGINEKDTAVLADTVVKLHDKGATFLEDEGIFNGGTTGLDSEERMVILSQITLWKLPDDQRKMLCDYFTQKSSSGCTIFAGAATAVMCGVAGLAGAGYALIDCASGGSAFADDEGNCTEHHMATLASSFSALGGAAVFGVCARRAYNDTVHARRSLAALNQYTLREVVVSPRADCTQSTPLLAVKKSAQDTQ